MTVIDVIFKFPVVYLSARLSGVFFRAFRVVVTALRGN